MKIFIIWSHKRARRLERRRRRRRRKRRKRKRRKRKRSFLESEDFVHSFVSNRRALQE